MYQRILAPLDGSATAEQALPYASLLGKGFNASIELLRVIDSPSMDLNDPDLNDPEHGAVTDQLTESARAQAEEYLTKVAGSLQTQGLDVSTSIITGDPASIIVAESEKAPGTLVTISTHGRSGITRWVMGSVSDKVLHATRAPMLMVRCTESAPGPSVNLSQIIVPLDGSELAEQALSHVVAVANALGLKTTLLRVTPSAGDYFKYMDYPPADYEDLAKDVDDDAVRYLDKINRRIKLEGVAQTEERLIHGTAAFAITDFVKEVPNALVAMTTHGRSGIGRWVMGSVADRVVRHSGGPVLVVRAEESDAS